MTETLYSVAADSTPFFTLCQKSESTALAMTAIRFFSAVFSPEQAQAVSSSAKQRTSEINLLNFICVLLSYLWNSYYDCRADIKLAFDGYAVLFAEVYPQTVVYVLYADTA